MSCDVGKATEGLGNELLRRWSDGKVGEWVCCIYLWALLILQPFRYFTYVTTHYPTLPSLYLRHSSFSNPYVASPTPQFILQPLFRFTYVTSPSLNSPGEPPMPTAHSPTFPLLHLRHSSFSNPSVALPTDSYPREWSRGMREGTQKLQLHVYSRWRNNLTVQLMKKLLIHSSRRYLIVCKWCSNVTVDVFCLRNNHCLVFQSNSYCRSRTNSSRDCFPE